MIHKYATNWYGHSSADALQSLSYSLCHVYAPSTRAVSVPAPVYCASSYTLLLEIKGWHGVKLLIKMLIWFVLVLRRILTRRNILRSILLPQYLVQQTLKLSRMATCHYMPINRRPCTLLYVLNCHMNNPFDLTAWVLIIVTSDNRHTQPSPLEIVMKNPLVLLHVIVFEPLTFLKIMLTFEPFCVLVCFRFASRVPVWYFVYHWGAVLLKV